jgi:hypothetical protein
MRALLVPALLVLVAAGCITPQNDAPTTTPSRPSTTTAGTSSCTSVTVTNPPSAGGGQGGVSNQPGSFSYGGQYELKTAKESYAWQNPSPTARASWGGQVLTGSLRVTIVDACGQKEMDQTVSMGQGGSFGALPDGRPGAWLITLEFTTFTGQMGLSVTS